MELKNQIALISGGLGDIGRAIARELASCGADIAIGDIEEEHEAAPFVASLQDLGRGVVYTKVDVSDPKSVEDWISTISNDLGVPTLIIPNAAIVRISNIRQISVDDWNQQLSVNLSGCFYMSRAAANKLVERKKKGRIIYIGSWAANRVHKDIPAYCVGKAGLRMLCKCMAAEYAENNIMVNEIALGIINAGLSGEIMKDQPQLQESIQARIPVNEFIEPGEVAKQVLVLCDPNNRHMTGSTLLMDGGLSLGNSNS
ncbi:MAG: SDR family oxidoreductase [Saprospiraceae bacterium]|nr:SDR family oxidoreductase [Saprospiraceae bacterium]